MKLLNDVEQQSRELPKDRMVKYPFPMRDGICCHFEIPRDITVKEVEAISRYLMSLAQ